MHQSNTPQVLATQPETSQTWPQPSLSNWEAKEGLMLQLPLAPRKL